MQRCADGNGQRVERRDPLVRINEQPLPVERHYLDGDARSCSRDRLCGIELMRANPGDAAEQDDGQCGDRPDHELEPAGIFPIGPVEGAWV